jgi:hypothetical protein
MLVGAGSEVDAGAPGLVQGVGRGVDHAGQELDAFEFAERGVRQDGLDRGAQAFVVDRPRKAAGEAGCQLLERHDLQAVSAVACGVEAKLTHRHAPVGDDGPPVGHAGHRPRLSALFLGTVPLDATP